jgi:hypothetical protein
MQITMKFDMPDDTYEYELARQAPNYHRVLHEIAGFLRHEIKHGGDEIRGIYYEEVRTKLFDIMRDFDIELDG